MVSLSQSEQHSRISSSPLVYSHSLFFNPNIPLHQLCFLNNSSQGPQQIFSPTLYKRYLRLSKSTSQKHKKLSHFEFHAKLASQIQTKQQTTQTELLIMEPQKTIFVSADKIVLQPPPLKTHLQKRIKRGAFQQEKIQDKKTQGSLKFYRLKNRFGFIKVPGWSRDVFICEDDLILSKVNMKHFKDDVYHEVPINLRFNVKTYIEKGSQRYKAVNIERLLV